MECVKIADRIRFIREDLKMSRAAFGDKIGVSGDVVNNMERDRVEIKDYMLRLLCKTYRLNYFWLTEGVGDPYLGPPDILLDDVIEEYRLDENDKEIIERYVKLDPEKRKVIKEFLSNIIKAPE